MAGAASAGAVSAAAGTLSWSVRSASILPTASCVSFSGRESQRWLKGSSLQLAVAGGRRFRRSHGFQNGCCFAALKKIADVESVELTPESSKQFPAAPGVYAIFNKEGKVQYVGISRKVSTSVQNHFQELPELCGSAKVCVVDAPDKSALTEAWRQWIQEYVDTTGEVPPGNVQGNTTWTARKQKAAKSEIKLTPGPHVTLTIPLVELIDKVVKSCEVVAFVKGTRTAPQCGFSHRVLTILNETGVEYEVVNVLDDHHNPGLREAIKVYSQWPTIPQVYVKGEFIGGADILDQLVQTGEIKQLFQSSRLIHGQCFVVGDNIDTDQIIPAEYLTLVPSKPDEYEKLGSYAMIGLPAEWGRFIDEGQARTKYAVMIAGHNFGCGSSREHAPVALGAAGVRAVVSESYARIFFRNSVATGELYPVESQDRIFQENSTGDTVTVDMDNNVLINHTKGKTFPLKPIGDAGPVIDAGGIFAYARKTGMIAAK